MKKNSFDITKSLQEGFNDFHKACGYKITVDAEYIKNISTSNISSKKRLSAIIKMRFMQVNLIKKALRFL